MLVKYPYENEFLTVTISLSANAELGITKLEGVRRERAHKQRANQATKRHQARPPATKRDTRYARYSARHRPGGKSLGFKLGN